MMKLQIDRRIIESVLEKIIEIVIANLDDPHVYCHYNFDCKVQLVKLLEEHEWKTAETLRWEVVTDNTQLYSCKECDRKIEAGESRISLFVAGMIFRICKDCINQLSHRLDPKEMNDPSYGKNIPISKT